MRFVRNRQYNNEIHVQTASAGSHFVYLRGITAVDSTPIEASEIDLTRQIAFIIRIFRRMNPIFSEKRSGKACFAAWQIKP